MPQRFSNSLHTEAATSLGTLLDMQISQVSPACQAETLIWVEASGLLE